MVFVERVCLCVTEKREREREREGGRLLSIERGRERMCRIQYVAHIIHTKLMNRVCKRLLKGTFCLYVQYIVITLCSQILKQVVFFQTFEPVIVVESIIIMCSRDRPGVLSQ